MAIALVLTLVVCAMAAPPTSTGIGNMVWSAWRAIYDPTGSGKIRLAAGGTNSTTAAGARTVLGLGSSDSPSFSGIKVGTLAGLLKASNGTVAASTAGTDYIAGSVGTLGHLSYFTGVGALGNSPITTNGTTIKLGTIAGLIKASNGTVSGASSGTDYIAGGVGTAGQVPYFVSQGVLGDSPIATNSTSATVQDVHTVLYSTNSTKNYNLLFADLYSTDAYGAYLVSQKARGTRTAPLIVENGDQVGGIAFQAWDGSKFVMAARMYARIGATPGADDMPGDLVFSTTADGAASTTERMRINSAGNIGAFGATTAAISSGIGLDMGGSTMRLRTARTPANSTATCNVGEIAWDTSYIHVCVGTNSWKRATLGTW